MKAALLTMLCAAPCIFGAAKPRTVAVLNFTNASGAPSLDYLKSALPESVSATLSQNSSVKVVERAQITKVLSEIQLEQSGVLDGGEISRAGKLAKADVLLIGQFSGNPEKLTVVLKAVDVTSGVVLDGRTVEASLGDVLVQSGAAANSMMAIVSGRDLGYLTISSTPDDAEVLLDGALIGKTPIVEYKMAAGEHRIFIKKKGFKEQDNRIRVNAGERKKISESLAPARNAYSFHLGAGYRRFIPQSNLLTQGNVIVPRLGVAFGKFTAGAEMGIMLDLDHSYSYNSAFGTAIRQDRSYYLTTYSLAFDFEPFNDATYVSPFVGVFGGYARASDYRKLGDNTDQKLSSNDLFMYGARAGIEIMPKFIVSFIIEGRYETFNRNITRSVSFSNGVLGGLGSTDTSLSLANFSIGGAVRFNLQ